jgi:virginiamycin A acetyltransferase
MYLNLKVPPYTIKEPFLYTVDFANDKSPFSILCIDVDSYIVDAKLETSLDFHVTDGVHNLQIGKYSSLAEGIVFLMDVDKNYKQVCIGAIRAFKEQNHDVKNRMKRKGQIIIQNECWIGNSVTIMGGVTIHNGAIIAAASVVTKDVPPYAIVGGNPARVIKYRFDEQQIQDLQRISWWNWSQDRIKNNAESFHCDVSEFISEHVGEANRELSNVPQLNLHNHHGAQFVYLFIPDFFEAYPIYEKVIGEFATAFNENAEMLIYIKQDDRFEDNKAKIRNILDTYSEHSCIFTVFTDNVKDERSLFTIADYYITTRAKENVQRMCFAELYKTKCISGVDIPVFGLDDSQYLSGGNE